ncbi:aminotransferase-like domain-containing protein [Vibrio mangrovi]|uniref:PLP-dependent aminotransferase family protein n=1 Tax=Vibrio mangrovi TaxID=474394 RepID=A0A1Y6IYR2_9VIBR|nr:PLP-dependent aminotransferase family protein [Vibrio mangrovi]MDW6002656.1 PLP-dependent aminotransferase family protein [Vibrio mangrovi]SMS02815.1 putative HTH-type transcriptional regulator YdcR [Vibrio mangrovi]
MSEAKFKQIAQTIISRIVEGHYPPNSKLPPHRVLADELNTTPVTVAKAYKLLAEQNRVESFVGRGTFVCGESRLSQAIHVSEDESEFNFSILQPCLSYNIMALQDAFQKAAGHITPQLIGYAEYSGHQQHRQVGVQWAAQYGLSGGTTQNTLLTDGAQNALSLLIEALTKPGDTIAVESLTYPGILAIASLMRREVVGVEMDEHGMIPEALQQALQTARPKLVIVIPSHQNPTGINMPPERRESIARIIRDSQTWLIEDDIYGFLNPEPVPAICNWIPEQGFHVTSLSKAISPALRCGFIKVPESQISTINAHIRAGIWLSSPFNYEVAAELMSSGQAFELAKQQQLLAQQRQQIVREILQTETSSQQGYHVWLRLPQHWPQERFVLEASKRHLMVSSGSYFAVRQPTDHIRLSLMSINSEQRLREGLHQLKALMETNMTTEFPFQV